ncbi:hypothetical protein J6590_070128 [Homalodisca vitripennis]|nr:hypothetical protein J6590_070128 [Homalodisca vitripennis]
MPLEWERRLREGSLVDIHPRVVVSVTEQHSGPERVLCVFACCYSQPASRSHTPSVCGRAPGRHCECGRDVNEKHCTL